jgi:hypothetical protein
MLSLEKGEIMKPPKRKRLERAGWRFGSAEEFLALSAEEQASG